MNKNCPVSGRSMNTRFMRGAPRLPVVLYSPLKPVVNIVFINMCDMVSRDALLMSPNLESTVHTFMPVGISLLELSELAR